MGFQKLNTEQKTALTYIIEDDESVNKNTLEMMLNNEIPGLVKTIYSRRNNDRILKYMISEYIPLSIYETQIYAKKNVRSIIFSMLEAIQNVYEYMIEAKYLVFDAEKVYYDKSRSKVVLVCLPTEHNDSKGSFADLVQTLAQNNEGMMDAYISELLSFIHANVDAPTAQFWKGIRQVHQRFAVSERQAEAGQPLMEGRKAHLNGNHENVAQALFAAEPDMVRHMNPNNVDLTENYSVDHKNNSDEESISFFYLMQHYNADNARKYREQKQKKKEGVSSIKEQSSALMGTPAENQSLSALEGQEQTSQTKKMSLMYLLQHYNADNARIYREQKVQKGSTSLSSTHNNQGMGVSYAIPGVKQNIGEPESPVMNRSAPQMADDLIQRVHANFGGTVFLPEEEKDPYEFDSQMEMVSMEHPHKYILVRKSNDERAEIDKPEFYVGRSQSKSDFVITNSPAIGRRHAKIIIRNNRCFLVDLGSLNKTFVNGVVIGSNEETQLDHGDQIRMANEEFLFLEE